MSTKSNEPIWFTPNNGEQVIQFMHFATVDPEGFAIVNVADISGFQSTPRANVTRLITAYDEYMVVGPIEFFQDQLRNYVGGEWDGVPEPMPEIGKEQVGE